MTINEHTETFAGLPVQDFNPENGLPEPASAAWRLTLGYDAQDSDESLPDRIAKLAETQGSAQVRALVIGTWANVATGDDSSEIVSALVAAKAKLSALRAIFLGDIVMEESEISWIQQSDVGPLLQAFPGLEEFRVRGGNGLRLSKLDHPALKKLIVESGGLSGDLVRDVAQANLPALDHLELWLGDENYGADWSMTDLEPILASTRLPRLTYLGLRNSEQADEIAKTVLKAPVLSRIRVLDLSLGNLSDEGGRALVTSPAVKSLQHLNLSHHYLSKDVMAALEKLGISVDLSDVCEADEHGGESYRYVAVSE
jgi:hypothetical protein